MSPAGKERIKNKDKIKKTPGFICSPSVIIHASVSVFAAIRSEETGDVVETEHIIIPTLTQLALSVNAYTPYHLYHEIRQVVVEI
jgi:hypothetical protein